MINRLAVGRVFPGEHNRARFIVEKSDSHIHLRMESLDQFVKVEVSGAFSTHIPKDSCFQSIDEASKFFESGSFGYSATSNQGRLDGIELRTQEWHVEPLLLEKVYSSYFADQLRFPEGSSSFDCALIMRDIQHGHGAYGAESAAAHAPSVRSQGANTLERLTSVAHRIHSVRARTDDGGLPRLDRLSEDREGRARIQVRVDRLAHGNPGQHRNLAGGVAELKIDFGPGYRVYYTVQGTHHLARWRR